MVKKGHYNKDAPETNPIAWETETGISKESNYGTKLIDFPNQSDFWKLDHEADSNDERIEQDEINDAKQLHYNPDFTEADLTLRNIGAEKMHTYVESPGGFKNPHKVSSEENYLIGRTNLLNDTYVTQEEVDDTNCWKRHPDKIPR